MSRTTTANRLRYRRSPHLVAYWRGDQLILEHYAGRLQLEAGPLVLDVLNRFPTWEPFETVAHQFPHVPRSLLRTLIDALVEHGALEATHDPSEKPAPTPWDPWTPWSPAASFFHQTTKDVPFTARDETNRRLKARATHDPIPPPLKPPYPGKRIALPPPMPPSPNSSDTVGKEPFSPPHAARMQATTPQAAPLRAAKEGAALRASTPGAALRAARPGETPSKALKPKGAPAGEVFLNTTSGALGIFGFSDVLLSRRTWRRFGRRRLLLEELSTLLGLTWGVQGWMDIEGWGRMALKTSPSGGARHSIEAYVVVRNVAGVTPGLYHYQPASHELHLVRRLTTQQSRAAIAAYLPQQSFYADASAVVLMSAVFARVQWRYAFPRAYRTVLAEAGHHAQTFCLTATWLGLAPFCTMALADSRIERDLKIDGVSESVLYATGVGPRPAGVTWAPWANTAATPVRTANSLGSRKKQRE